MPKNNPKAESAASIDKDIDKLVGEMEPWESWETKLIWWSIIIGLIVLVIGGVLTQMLI